MILENIDTSPVWSLICIYVYDGCNLLVCFDISWSRSYRSDPEFALPKILPFRIDLQKAQDSQNDLSALFLSGGKSLFDVFISGIEMIHFIFLSFLLINISCSWFFRESSFLALPWQRKIWFGFYTYWQRPKGWGMLFITSIASNHVILSLLMRISFITIKILCPWIDFEIST